MKDSFLNAGTLQEATFPILLIAFCGIYTNHINDSHGIITYPDEALPSMQPSMKYFHCNSLPDRGL